MATISECRYRWFRARETWNDAAPDQQSGQFVAGVWPLSYDLIEFGRAHTKVPRDACEIAAVHVAKFTHLLTVLEPVAEQIDGVFDDRTGLIWFAMACSLTWLNWVSVAAAQWRVIALDQTRLACGGLSAQRLPSPTDGEAR